LEEEKGQSPEKYYGSNCGTQFGSGWLFCEAFFFP
jgi:hypothetical protein